MITTTTAAIVALILLPLIVIVWATESKTQRQTRQAKRLSHHYGLSQREIAQRLGVSQSTVSRRLKLTCYCINSLNQRSPMPILIDNVKADPTCWECPELDTDLHILNSLGEPLALPEHIDASDWVSEQEPALLRWFARQTQQQYRAELRDNTYNSDNDFSANFVFTIYAPEGCSDWCWENDIFVTVERHLGGDVRGNYGHFSVFRVDSIAESGFLDWVCGWYASPLPADADSEHPGLVSWNERFSIGYSRWPTGEVRDALVSKEPVWCDTRKAWLARLQDVPFPVVLTPTAPYYC